MEESCEFIAFMAAIRHDHIDYVVEVIQEYSSVTEWLISLETADKTHLETEGEHMHFLIRMSPIHYKNFADRIFVKKFKLRGQAMKGKPRQYGKLREIHDLERMGMYTCKEDNLRTNIQESTVKRWVETAFKKDDVDILRNNIYEHLDKMPIPTHIMTFDGNALAQEEQNTKKQVPPCYLRMEILQYFRDNCDKIPNPNTIKSYVTGYILYHAKEKYSISDVDLWLFGSR